MVRAKEDFKKKQPQLLVADHHGYIALHLDWADMSMPIDLYAKDMGVWNFKVRAKLTDARHSLWREANLNVNELALPLAISETPEITGAINEDKITKKVELNYMWKPNKLGQSLDPNSATFCELPHDLQHILKNPKFNLFGTTNRLVNFTQARGGVAYFKNTTMDGACRI